MSGDILGGIKFPMTVEEAIKDILWCLAFKAENPADKDKVGVVASEALFLDMLERLVALENAYKKYNR